MTGTALRPARLLVLLPLAMLPCARADDDASRAAAKREETALLAVQDELIRLARLCAENDATVEARDELEHALALCPTSEKVQAEVAKLSGKEPHPKPTFPQLYETERKMAHEKCGDILADLALADERASQNELFSRHAAWILEQFPRDAVFARLGVVWFEPYLRLVKEKDAKLLEAGGELVEGKWLDAQAVAALDSQHATWTRPWVVSDAAHEVRTTLPLRTANRLLAHVGAFREFFLRQFGGTWDLRAPKTKLTVIATGSQADFRARILAHKEKSGAKDKSVPSGAAIYLHETYVPGPCFVTFEPTFEDGPAKKIGIEGVAYALRHELTHQIAFEYSKHAADRARKVKYQAWCVEGLAGYLEAFEIERGRWSLGKHRFIATGGPPLEGSFALCVRKKDTLPPLEKVFSLPRERLTTEDYYDESAGIAYFLLEGEGRRYRSGFLKLLETVHRVRDDESTFEACFPGVDCKRLQEEWLRFLANLKLSD